MQTFRQPREATVQRFACTQCGQCCNRSPEIELSEAAALADVFVFKLMFRLHWLPRRLVDYLDGAIPSATRADVVFYERKRLLSAFAARKYPVRMRRNGQAVEFTKYLMISALALDTVPGGCSALNGALCGIYERRPVTCRAVPLHYARRESLAESDLKAFVATPGYRCDTSEEADAVLDAGRIIDAGMQEARTQALAVAIGDRPWAEAIARRLKGDTSTILGLPTLREIETNAEFGATTTSMRIAWDIAADAGLIGAQECRALVAAQLDTIERELRAGSHSQELLEMQSEYRHHLTKDPLPLAATSQTLTQPAAARSPSPAQSR